MPPRTESGLPPRTVFIHTYGCQMNERDSEAAAALLAARGYRVVDNEAAADIVIVNTCSVREKAEDKALGKLGLLAAPRRRRPGRIVGVMGCMVQRMGEDLLRRVKGLDFAVGTRRLSQLPALLEAVAAGYGPIVDTGGDDDAPDAPDGHQTGASTAFVNILFGCDRHCSYCIVPHVRGREWSRTATSVVGEVSALVASGVSEVTLLGQSVMSYGRANEVWPGGPVSRHGFTEPLPRLLEALDSLPGLARLRFTSGHPSGCTEELARAMGILPRVCEHLHLPMQSGSDRILKAMRRGYTADAYRAAVARLRRHVPTLALTTDIIVGFPGETAEDFECTRSLMEEIGFDNAFIFKYSPRPGTPAADWADDVPAAVKAERNQQLLAEQNRRGLLINRRLVGQTMEVLVEGTSPRNPERWAGRTRTNKIVLFEPDAHVKAGELHTLRVERALAQTLYGVRVQ